MRAYRTLKLQTLVIATIYIAVTLICIQFLPPVPVILITSSLAVTAISWRLFRAIDHQNGEQQFKNYRQMEALSGIYNTLDIRHPLPPMRHTAASPDFLYLLANEIFRIRPNLIVEVGSGTSTLIAAYCLRKIGKGRIISLDHLQKYADITRQTIESHDLAEFATVHHAPLKSYTIDDRDCQWYDIKSLLEVQRIDMLIVDGPPKDISSQARYPAIPILREKFRGDSVALLDDGNRPDETEIVELWKQRYDMDYSFKPTEKGAYLCYLSR